jgi:aromatic-L-amino-acid decarboxylase
LGRRFRSLKLWLVLRTYGLEGIRSYLRHHCELAAWFASRVQESEIFELAAPPRLGLVCFRLKAAAGETPEASSAKTAKLVERVNARGRVSVTSARLGGEGDGRCIVRVAIGGSNTMGGNVELAWGELLEVARGILEG